MFYFYDLETTGLNPKWHRIMQFAGQLTDEDFNPIGEADNWVVKLTPEVLPDPEAILVTGITPQKTLEEGITEAELLERVTERAFKPKTTVLGYNTLRFDDEFLRYTLFRNFYDPYEREYKDDRTRWDIVDVVRMMRALRPDGLEWAFDSEGKPTNRLEALSKANKISHENAHDALSDVLATIDLTKLIKHKQPQLFEHLYSLRLKKNVSQLLERNQGKPLIHSSGKFSSDFLGTSAVVVIGQSPSQSNEVLVYDLRYSPKPFANLTPDELSRLAFTPRRELAEGEQRLPVKSIKINRSPALAPLGVLDEGSEERIKLTKTQIMTHLKELQAIPDFTDRIEVAWQRDDFEEGEDVDSQLYAGFTPDADKKLMQQVRNRDATQLADYHPMFKDARLSEMLLRYKARNFPTSLSQDEQQLWEQYRAKRLTDTKEVPINLTKYMNKLMTLAKERTDKESQFILQELQLYAESIAPFENQELL